MYALWRLVGYRRGRHATLPARAVRRLVPPTHGFLRQLMSPLPSWKHSNGPRSTGDGVEVGRPFGFMVGVEVGVGVNVGNGVEIFVGSGVGVEVGDGLGVDVGVGVVVAGACV